MLVCCVLPRVAPAQEVYGSTLDAQASAARTAAAEDGVEVAALAEAFCAVYPDLRSGGLPAPTGRHALEPLITLGLDGALTAARHLHDAAIRQAPGDKPPFADGDLFSSLFEGATSCRVGAVTLARNTASVELRYAHETGTLMTSWTDRLSILRGNDGWRIDDVVYDGRWDFANTGSLRGMIESAAAADAGLPLAD
ncbi:hypothetical protein [Tistrella mobilis]